MDESRKKQLEAAGIDVGDALARFMNNEGLMMKFLLRFPQDQNYQRLCQAMEAQDAAAAYEAAHTLKGVAGNLSMKGLYARVCDVVEDLRGGDLAAAAGKMDGLRASYQQTLDAVNAAAG